MVTLKKRLDILLVEKGFFSTREKAKSIILSGLVKVNDKFIDKPGIKIQDDTKIEVREKGISYVSRGGIKLAGALKEFTVKVKDKVILDVGASTGGFTDCLLQKGAKKVYAVDVGYGQLDWKLRNAPRVINIERTNIRYLKEDKIGEKIDLATIDVSFISLEKVIPVVSSLMRKEGEIIALIKPQFEAGRAQVKKGVVRDPCVHQAVIEKIKRMALKEKLKVEGVCVSPLRGPAGNIEYFIYCCKL